MISWQEFLVANGGRISDGAAMSFGETPADYPALATKTIVADIGNEGVLAVEGVDGAKFLQGQTTCDVNATSPTATIAGAFCNPKGRVIADFRAIAVSANRILLAMHRGLVPITQQAVSKYAAFFKAQLTDRSADYRQFGIAGPDADTLIAKHFPDLPTHSGAVIIQSDALAVRLDEDRFLVLATNESAIDIWNQLTVIARPVGQRFWQLLNIRAGQGRVFPTTSGEFIPQMLNFQATGAISFKKGCYTGQEVVARMQYLGKLKRHMYRLILASSAIPEPGTDVFVPGNGQSAGTLVYAAPATAHECEALVVLKDDVLKSSTLLFGSDSVTVRAADLPYTLDKA